MRAGFIATLALAVISAVSAAPVELEKRFTLMNNFNCRPSAEHPVPLVLVHATFATASSNWGTMGNRFQVRDYCVFQLDYGRVPLLPGIGGMDRIEDSAQELKEFIDRVLAGTKATRVDMLGHSQGGLMPLYYMKRLGGASKVRKFGALAPATHGTTMSGLANGSPDSGASLGVGCQSCTQMMANSAFLTDLFRDGDTVPGVDYFMLSTKEDTVITPYTNSYLRDQNPRVTNKAIQDYCFTDNTSHIGMSSSGLAFNIMDNFFTPTAGRMLNCLTV